MHTFFLLGLTISTHFSANQTSLHIFAAGCIKWAINPANLSNKQVKAAQYQMDGSQGLIFMMTQFFV